MRPIWKGSISFGLVYIPIAVYPATREEKLSFRQLRASDLSPIKYKKVAEADMKEVVADQIVKGFEYERGRYIVLKDDDFEKVRIESTHSIDITDFVELEQVDPKFFYKPYFLEPQKGGEKAYALLHKALSGTGKIGVAKVVISNREYLAAVKPDGLFLILELMHFASEVLTPDELNRPKTELNEKELKMAHALIESMSGTWEPKKYRDEYRDAVMELIEQKANKKEIGPKIEVKPRATNVVDLVKVLQESLNRNQSLKVKRGSGRNGPRSSSALVKQKRRSILEGGWLPNDCQQVRAGPVVSNSVRSSRGGSCTGCRETIVDRTPLQQLHHLRGKPRPDPCLFVLKINKNVRPSLALCLD
jgi:DNA end-binding protein Ku